MRLFNLSTVIRFEIARTLKKKSFWLVALGFPIMMALIFVVVFVSNKSTSDAASNLEKERFSLEITDDSHMIKPSLVEAIGAKEITSQADGIAAVQSGKIDGYIYFPADLAKQSVKVYGQDVGIFDNGRYNGVANFLLTQSAQQEVPSALKTVLAGTTAISVVTYRDGTVYEPLKQMILPGVFLILFYLLIAFFGSQMLTSTTEEKENRVIEMILTTIEARTLIIGKIISLILLAFLQGAIVVVPAIIGYLLFHNQLNIPDLDLSSLPFDWGRMLTGFVIFVTSFTLFTGLLVLIGAAVPTAKEAGQFFGLIMMLIFGPLYAVTLFISAPDSPIVRFLSLFPLTAPIPLLLRNAVGNLTAWEAIVAIAIMMVTAVVILILAVRVFRFGALEYSRKLSLR
ncbi:MAG: ABC transporter permease, partial [Candidatus Saccharimonas sp.]